MKLFVIALAAALLTGCSTVVPIKQTWPDAPPSLEKACPPLKEIDPTNKSITDLLSVVIENYALYQQCSGKVEGWNDWYNKQKKVFEQVK